jgi:hypothetical protein
MTNNGVNVNEVLKEDYVTPTSPHDGKYTKTTQFMLPSIGLNVRNKLIFRYFINSYLDDKGHRHQYERPIFVLFGVTNFTDRDWQKVYAALAKSSNYRGDYDCGIQDGKNLVMMVFKVPDEFEQDYYNFKRGRYSKFSELYKEKFPEFIGDEEGTTKRSLIWQVLHRDPELARQLEELFGMDEGELDRPTNGIHAREIWDLPRKNREYYRYTENIPRRQEES